jgi:hypothetical protein
LRRKFGDHLFILPQCSAAGDQNAVLLYDNEAYERMLRLQNLTAREAIALRIVKAIEEILTYIQPTINFAPSFMHKIENVQIPLNQLTQDDLIHARQQVEHYQEIYNRERYKMLANSDLQYEPRWYLPITNANRLMRWHQDVITRYEKMSELTNRTIELHVIRVGELVFATNPFEYYLDYGIQIKLRSPAIQTFLVQLTGEATYVPTPRSVKAGGYGSMPANNPIGSEGGQLLAERTLSIIQNLWKR